MESSKSVRELMAIEIARHVREMDSLKLRLAYALKEEGKPPSKRNAIKGAWRAWINGDGNAVVPDPGTETDCVVIKDTADLTSGDIQCLRNSI